jgi:hypothetical protein
VTDQASIDGQREGAPPSRPDVPLKFPASRMQRYCYDLAGAQNFQADMNINICIRFDPGSVARGLDWRLVEELKRQGILRVRFAFEGDELFQYFDPTYPLPVREKLIEASNESAQPRFSWEDTNHYSRTLRIPSDFVKQIQSLAREDKRTRIDLEKDAPVRITRIPDNLGGVFLVLTFHHAVADSASFVAIMRRLEEAGKADANAGCDLRFLERSLDFHEAYCKRGERQLRYWTDFITPFGDEASTSLLEWKTFCCAHQFFDVPASSAALSQRYSKFEQALYLSCFLLAWERTGNSQRAFVISTINHRKSPQDSNVFGCYFRHVIWANPLFTGALELDDLFRNLVRQAMRAYANVDVSLGDIIERYRSLRGAAPRIELSFTYRDLSGLSGLQKDSGIQVMPLAETVLDERLPLQFHVSKLQDQTTLDVIYNPGIFGSDSIRTLGRAFQDEVRKALA